MRKLVELNESQKGLTPTQIEEFLLLEAMISNAKLDAEVKVQHISATPWSPKLLKARHLVKYWQSWRLELRHGKDRSEYRSQIMPIAPGPNPPTMQEVTKHRSWPQCMPTQDASPTNKPSKT